MKTLLPSLLLCAALLHSGGAEPAKPPAPAPEKPAAGWNKVRWGMTAAEVVAVYPEAKPCDADQRIKLGVALISGLSFKGFELAGAKWDVRFLMDSKQRLAGVLVARTQETPMPADCEKMESLLVQKYGPPSVSSKAEKDLQSKTWHRPGVSIMLECLALPTVPAFGLSVTYLKPNADALEKL